MPLRIENISMTLDPAIYAFSLTSQSDATLSIDLMSYCDFNGSQYTFNFSTFFGDFPTIGYITNLSSDVIFYNTPSNVYQVGNIHFFDLATLTEYLQLSLPSTPFVPSSLPSLNGDYYSFNDGESVYTFPDNRNYKVSRSYLVYSGEASHILMYDLVDSDNKIISCPHTFCSKILPVV